MSTLLGDPYNFVQGQSIVIRVTASNSLGTGPTSEVSSSVVANVQTVPHKPTQPLTVDSDNTNETQIKLTWATPPGVEDGGSDILSYNLQYDQGQGLGTFFELVGNPVDYTSQEFTILNSEFGLTPGANY
jgi:hypothetical protein